MRSFTHCDSLQLAVNLIPKRHYPRFWNSWVKWEIQRVSLGLCGNPSLPVCSLSQDREREGLTQHSSPPHNATHFEAPSCLCFTDQRSCQIPYQTLPQPSHTHTHKHHKPSKIAGTAQIGGAPWERGVTGSGVRQLQKRKKGERGKKTSTEAIPLNSIGCMSCCGPVTLWAPALPPSLPPSHSGNYDIYYRGEGRAGEETGRGALG